ncbi:uncharacterized protein LOC119564054 isoform X3 [Chelonia mydas]|uniref:uncharacterized protein LOC119564054 isoform X3 n=1 Tax=Chelonia mydas TaxID=8469 RepID=UPI001CA88AEC|nr:uncharacterized protein LOC119564054 isoform X3 [Chelonia mydas]
MILFITIMLFAKYLLLSFMVVQVQLFLHQLQSFLFVNINDTAKIQCSSKKQFLAGGITARWYRRREDSYTTSSWVLTLAPSPHGLLSPGTADLACVVHGVSNLVQISWSFSGDLQEQGLMRSLKAKDGSFVFINHISVPTDTWTSGKNFTCDVKFNSSGKSVKKIARYIEAPASECSHYIVPLAAGAGLLLLVVSLSLVWTLCPSALGFQPRVSAPPASEEPQGGILYAHLDFDSRNHNGRTMQRPARGKRVKP